MIEKNDGKTIRKNYALPSPTSVTTATLTDIKHNAPKMSWLLLNLIADTSNTKFTRKLQEIEELCGINTYESPDLSVVFKKRTQALHELKNLTTRTTPDVTSSQAASMTHCALILVRYFHFDIDTKEYLKKSMPKKVKVLQKALDVLSMVAKRLVGESKAVIMAALEYLNEVRLWYTGGICVQVFKRLMFNDERSAQVITLIFGELEKPGTDIRRVGRLMIKMLSDVLDGYKWKDVEGEMLMQMLTLYYKSANVRKFGERYSPLTEGLEICIMEMIKHIPNAHIFTIIDVFLNWILEEDNESTLYDYCTILQLASKEYEIKSYSESLTEKLFESVIHLIESPSSTRCLLGHQMFQNFVDRHSNGGTFFPRTFFRGMHYNFNLETNVNEAKNDEAFFELYREEIHDSFMSCIMQHGKQRGILEAVFVSLGLLLIEVRCGFTAALVSSISMNIQEYFLSESSERIDCSHRAHALVLSLLSLVCWVHDAEIFFDYLYSVMLNRAYEAPFLNPPMKSRYQYAENHVLWNKKDLFFEDWQVRYGLWKRFRRPDEEFKEIALNRNLSNTAQAHRYTVMI